jgi:hypothetical protein
MHANFVLDSEKLLKFEHALSSAELLFAEGRAKDDIADASECIFPDLDSAAETAANRRAVLQDVGARYGNSYMGPRTVVPCHPDIPTLEYFRGVYKADSPDGTKGWYDTLKMRKWLPFAKCDTCSAYRTALANTVDPKVRTYLRREQAAHLAHTRRERASYMLRQKAGILWPERFLSLIFDGADCSKTEIPQMSYRSHASSAAQKVKMHLMGAIAHGLQAFLFTCPPHIAQGHNVTIQALFAVLVHVKRTTGRIPPILYIQLDNTTKQNKGKFLMGYLGTLVKAGVIQEAFVHFLPVGHTHEDIDQLFSRVSVYMRRHDAPDDEALRQCCRRSFKKYGKPPIVVAWEKVANISGYLKPLLSIGVSDDITLYHHIRIARARLGDHAGEVVLQARTWPGSPDEDKNDFWRGLKPETHYVNLFRQDPDLVRDRFKIPSQAQPEHIGNVGGKDFLAKRTAFTESVEKTRQGVAMLATLYPSLFTQAVQANWTNLLRVLVSNLDTNNPVAFAWNKVHTQAHRHTHTHMHTHTHTRTHTNTG